jgi:hypothetical protein
MTLEQKTKITQRISVLSGGKGAARHHNNKQIMRPELRTILQAGRPFCEFYNANESVDLHPGVLVPQFAFEWLKEVLFPKKVNRGRL